MIFRNSMTSIFRSRGKTALFTLLIFSLTIALTLGVSVWTSVDQFLEDCAEYYTTIGLVEYMGTKYPDDVANDTAMAEAMISFDASQITNDVATLSWNEPSRSLGFIDGFWRSDKHMPGRMNSVFVIGNITYSQRHQAYTAIISEVLYSLFGEANTILVIDADFGTFEKGHYYLVFGEVYDIGSPLNNFRLTPYDNEITKSMGIEVPQHIDITSDGKNESYIIPDDSVLLKVASTLEITNNSVLVSGTDDLLSILPFHQEELYITKGRSFTDEEYANGDHVIVISDLIAARLGVEVGDTIDLSVAVSDLAGVYNSYWTEFGFSYNGPFRVVGITNTIAERSWYVYVPKSAGVPSSPHQIGYTVGHAIINNEDAAEFNERIEPLMKDRLQLTIYDQGYANVAIPFRTILSVAKIVTIVCLLLVLAVAILFGFLFIYRQQETSEIMLSLGAGRMRVSGYFLFSAGLISLIGTFSGAIAGYFFHDGIISIITKAAENFTLIDSRFSNGNLSNLRTLEFAPHLELQLFLMIGAAVFVLLIFACMAFVIRTFINQRPSQRSQHGPKKERNTSHLNGGSIKYAVLSALRGGARTLVVPIVSLVVVIFFGQLATTSNRYQEQLDTIYKNTTIVGNYTDIKGKQVGNLVLNGMDVSNLYHEGLINTLTISRSEPYYFVDTSMLADGTDMYLSPLYVPRSSFAANSLESEILRGPDLTAINDMYTSPEFLYADTILLNFLDGYDESFLTAPVSDDWSYVCIVPTSLMEKQGLVLGDTIRVALPYRTREEETNELIFLHFDLLVIGSYEKQGAEDTIYSPLSLFFDTSLIWGEGQTSKGAPTQTFDSGYTLDDEQKNWLPKATFNSAHFVLSETPSLTTLKDYLTDYGYSQVKKVSSVREFIVLRDASFNNSVASVKQQIHYINTLYPLLYVLVGIIAIVVSYLMVVSRKMEFAIMRGLGTTRLRSFMSFFIEQSFLCMAGIIAGVSIWILMWGIPGILQIALTSGFLLCYLLGSAISVTIMNHTNVLTILSDRE